MFIDRLMNGGSGPLLEQVVRFTAARHDLIAQNIANVDTVGYRQKDLSVAKFEQLLQRRVEAQRAGESGGFEDAPIDVENSPGNILFHDQNNRSMERLQTDLAKNAMLHNMAIELLRKQYQQLDMALKERVV